MVMGVHMMKKRGKVCGNGKRKMLMGMHMMMKRGKVCGRSLMNLVFHHSRGDSDGGFGLQEYEFSCSNSPANPVAKRKHYHLPANILHCSCIRPHPVEDHKEELSAFVLPLLDYDNGSCSRDCPEHGDMPSLEKPSPLLSPLYRRTLSLSGEGNNDHQVDRQAEEFIAKFYEQLRLQNQMSFRRYQEMLDRGIS